MQQIEREPLPREQRRAAATLVRAMRLLMKQNRTMQLPSAVAFLQVAEDGNKCVAEHAKKHGSKQPTMSKLLAELGPTTEQRGDALGLITKRPLPTNRRRTEVSLSAKGRALAEELAKIIRGQ